MNELEHTGKYEVEEAATARTETYRENLLVLVGAFEFELCETCLGDIDVHVIAPDVLGNPHLYCMNEEDE